MVEKGYEDDMPKRLEIYLDTSIPNAYFDDKNPFRKEITKEFWKKLDDYEIFVSDLVIKEIEDKRRRKMPYFSEFYQIEVRDEIVKEFTNSRGDVDDMMAGLHEIRMRRAEKEFDLEALAKRAELFRMPRKKQAS
ncbi:MAG: hypothetical protein AAB116_08030 [Candidatus Poribacteria bacterium]